MPEFGMFGGLKGFFGLGIKNETFKPNIAFASFNFLRWDINYFYLFWLCGIKYVNLSLLHLNQVVKGWAVYFCLPALSSPPLKTSLATPSTATLMSRILSWTSLSPTVSWPTPSLWDPPKKMMEACTFTTSQLVKDLGERIRGILARWPTQMMCHCQFFTQTYHDLIPPITGVLPVGGLDAGLASWSLLSTLAGMETSWRGKGKWTIELISGANLKNPLQNASCTGWIFLTVPTQKILSASR